MSERDRCLAVGPVGHQCMRPDGHSLLHMDHKGNQWSMEAPLSSPAAPTDPEEDGDDVDAVLQSVLQMLDIGEPVPGFNSKWFDEKGNWDFGRLREHGLDAKLAEIRAALKAQAPAAPTPAPAGSEESNGKHLRMGVVDSRRTLADERHADGEKPRGVLSDRGADGDYSREEALAVAEGPSSLRESAAASPAPQSAPAGKECAHDFREFTVCRKCGRTEAAIVGCHHCDEDPQR